MKTFVLFDFFVETMMHAIISLMENSKTQYLFEIEIFCNIVKKLTTLTNF